jgi:transposase InsO family protein
MIAQTRQQDPTTDVAAWCEALDVSRSGYYDHRRKAQRPRRQSDENLAKAVHDCFHASRQTYGTPRLRVDLRDLGHRVGRRRIGRLMRQQNLRPKQKRRFVPKTTDSRHGKAVAPPTLLKREALTAPGQVWVTDITYIPTQEGWLYLAAEMDLFSRRIVGWHAKEHMERGLVIEAFQSAVSASRGSLRGLLHHSDQGSQYVSADFVGLLDTLGVERSMSRRGNCYDNAAMESFWATLKAECFDSKEIPATRQQARSMIFDYIEAFYNPRRRHSSLGYVAPLQFEQQHSTLAA